MPPGLYIGDPSAESTITNRDAAAASLCSHLSKEQSRPFVKPPSGDLRFLKNPVIDKKDTLAGLTDDFDSRKRPRNIDVGIDTVQMKMPRSRKRRPAMPLPAEEDFSELR